jgi:hypothetical protein
MTKIAAIDAPENEPKNVLANEILDDETLEDEAIKVDTKGTVFISVPRLKSYMKRPDRVQVLTWHLQEGDIVEANADEREMITLDFLGNDWELPIPPFLRPMRVARIAVGAGTTIHLFDPLIVFEPVSMAA